MLTVLNLRVLLVYVYLVVLCTLHMGSLYTLYSLILVTCVEVLNELLKFRFNLKLRWLLFLSHFVSLNEVRVDNSQ